MNDDWENEILFPDSPPEPTPEEIIEIEGEPEARITNKEIISAWKIVRNGLLQRCDQQALELTNDLTMHLARLPLNVTKTQSTLDNFLLSHSSRK
jgi:hypothetical protein